MLTKKSVGLFSLALFLGIGTVAYWYRGVSLTFHPTVGTRLNYAVDYRATSDTILDAKNTVIQQFPRHTEVSLKGNLVLTVLQEEKAVYRLAGELQAAEISGLPNAELRTMPFALSIGRDGHVRDISFPEAQFADSSFIVIDLLKRIDQQLPADKVRRGSEWVQVEHQLNDSIQLATRVHSLSDSTVALQKTPKAMHFKAQGREDHTWDVKKGFLAEVQVARTLIQKDIQGLSIASQLNVQLRLTDRATLPADKLASLPMAYTVKENLQQEQLQKRMAEHQAEVLLKGMTAADIRTAYDQASNTDMRANMEIYQKLKALFRLKPESIATFKDLLLTLDRNDRRFQMLAAALTAVGNHEAQVALMDAIHRSDDDVRRMQLVPHVGMMKEPAEDSERFMRQLAAEDASEQVRQTAELALGTMAHQLRESAPDRTTNIYQTAAEDLQKSQTNAEIEQRLAVIGNIGVPAQVELVKPYLAHTDDDVRATAYSSLRFVEEPAARDLLLQGLTREKTDVVREHVAEGLTYVNPSAQVINDIEQHLTGERNITVIKNLLRVLAVDAATNTATRAYIQKFEQNCAHPDLCSFVAGLLSTLSDNQPT